MIKKFFSTLPKELKARIELITIILDEIIFDDFM